MTVIEMQTMETIKAAAKKIPDLRDLFAMQALNGMLANGGHHGSPEAFAEQAYTFADAMLKARGNHS